MRERKIPMKFHSPLATLMSDFIQEKQSLGYKYEIGIHALRRLDHFLCAFKLLLYYCRDHHGRSVERLSALHAFFRYLQTEEPERMVQCQRILAIPLQRCAQPNLATPWGRRDAVLLSLLYDTAARVQELVDLSVGDVRLDTPAQIRLTGKGRKARVVPLLSATVALLSDYLEEQQLNRPERLAYPLFWNRRRERLTRSGIRYILVKYAHQARTQSRSLPRKITPHLLRHSKAMHLLHAGNPTTVIQAILGHADLRTTDIYYAQRSVM